MTLRLPVFGTLVLAVVFFLVTAPVKETPSLFDHAPWLNDPFDTVISFMILLVPLIAVLCMPRLLLCRRSEPLPATRIRDLLRGCRVLLAGVGYMIWLERKRPGALQRGATELVGRTTPRGPPQPTTGPMTAATFILLPKDPPNKAAAKDAIDFFKWAYDKGDKMAEDLDYIPMPDSVVALVEKMWTKDVKLN